MCQTGEGGCPGRRQDGVSILVSLEADIIWEGLESCFWEEIAIILGKERNLR